jgi:hypothetical protein
MERVMPSYTWLLGKVGAMTYRQDEQDGQDELSLPAILCILSKAVIPGGQTVSSIAAKVWR